MGIKVGTMLNPVPPLELSVGMGVQAEAAGYDSVWFPDHLMRWFPRALWTPEASTTVILLPSPHLYLDPTVLIALVGHATERVTRRAQPGRPPRSPQCPAIQAAAIPAR